MTMVLINEIPTEVGHGSDEIICLRKENAALKADAERYRWLRDTQEGKTVRIMYRREWDKAIDEAIRKEILK